ncbi:hypothetical protein DLAC_10068 [Tieghemostelium lacteum]|uniref:N-acetyltransferase domain-containing protein n=1 Tax=Tieghemostelium lacteum TaxID=361077 RepID=A0A151Z649_TIELA|nr:hypothetical protein DLAC_10068 [Tieghemostelium lacteum]|eukprot:KYQ89408.1 hypothetical protein DLAC_10068 [Tieghemostelium lacteum]
MSDQQQLFYSEGRIINTKDPNISIRLRYIEERDVDNITTLLNWSYVGKSKDQWTTVARFVTLQFTKDMVEPDLTVNPDLKKIFIFERYPLTNSTGINSIEDIVGSVSTSRDSLDSDRGYISRLFVNPSYQGLGIGNMLLRLAEEYIHQVYKYSIFTLEIVSPRDELLKWYQSNNYKICGRSVFDFPNAISLVDDIHYIKLIKYR